MSSTSARSRSFNALLILSLLVISVSALPGSVFANKVTNQDATQAATASSTQAATQAATQPVGPVLDKIDPGETKIGTISAQNPESRYEINVKAKDEAFAGL